MDGAQIQATMSDVSGNPHTPFQEAISIIGITAILVAVGCYIAALKNLPVLSPLLFWVAVQVYHLFPALRALRGAQVPMLVSAATVGTVLFIFTIPLAYWLAGLFSRAGIESMELQSAWLKRHREKLKNRKRDRDDFVVS